MSEKRNIQSRLTDLVQVMSRAEYAEFSAVHDETGSKFFDAGPATPDEATAPRLTPRAVAPVIDVTPAK